MTPSVGRIVHYVSYGTPDGEYGRECRAAIITKVTVNRVGLCVLNPNGQFFNESVCRDDGDGGSDANMCDGNRHEGGTWHVPAKV